MTDRRKQITGFLATKKTGEEEGEALFPAPVSPTFTRALRWYQKACLSAGVHVL